MTDQPTPQKSENPKPENPIARARNSFSGRLLGDATFHDAIRITQIMERQIQHAGTFKEKLTDYSHAFARTANFDTIRSETIIRDLFKERTGQSMNDLRKALVERGENITDADMTLARDHAQAIEQDMRGGKMISFNRARSNQAQRLGSEIGVTDLKASQMMREAYELEHGKSFESWREALDGEIFTPQLEAEKQDRASVSQTASKTRFQTSSQTKSRARSRG